MNVFINILVNGVIEMHIHGNRSPSLDKFQRLSLVHICKEEKFSRHINIEEINTYIEKMESIDSDKAALVQTALQRLVDEPLLVFSYRALKNALKIDSKQNFSSFFRRIYSHKTPSGEELANNIDTSLGGIVTSDGVISALSDLSSLVNYDIYSTIMEFKD